MRIKSIFLFCFFNTVDFLSLLPLIISTVIKKNIALMNSHELHNDIDMINVWQNMSPTPRISLSLCVSSDSASIFKLSLSLSLSLSHILHINQAAERRRAGWR